MPRSQEEISKNMKKIRGKDTSIEVRLRKALWQKGLRYRKNYKALPGSPDIALTKYKIAVFCDSEFFHGKDWEALKLRLEKGKNPDSQLLDGGLHPLYCFFFPQKSSATGTVTGKQTANSCSLAGRSSISGGRIF